MGLAKGRRTKVAVILVALVAGGCADSSGEAGTSLTSFSSVSEPSMAASTTTSGAATTTSTLMSYESTTEPVDEAPPGSIRVEMAGPPPRFLTPELVATAGDVVFHLVNTGVVGDPRGDHVMVIGPEVLEQNVKSDRVKSGDSAAFTVKDLPAGEYAFWCTLNNHYSEGMVGTLTVVEE
jgi:uncharacterized cupredoxin-like copper-binding protein